MERVPQSYLRKSVNSKTRKIELNSFTKSGPNIIVLQKTKLIYVTCKSSMQHRHKMIILFCPKVYICYQYLQIALWRDLSQFYMWYINKLDQRWKLHLLLKTFKCLKGNGPVYLSSQLSLATHFHHTRCQSFINTLFHLGKIILGEEHLWQGKQVIEQSTKWYTL